MLRATAPFSSNYGQTKSQNLRNILVSLLKERGLSESTQLYECVDDDTICKTMVLVSDQISRSAVSLRSYASKSDGGASFGDLTITDAALASVAGPMSSTPVAIGHKRLIAADYTGYANPSKEAFDEATRIWRVDSIKTIVSLGTGVHEQNSKMKSGLWAMIDLSANVLNDFDRVDQELYRDSRIAGFDCFRFKGPAAPNVPLVSKVGRNDWNRASLVEDLTQQYIHRPEVKSSLVACAQNLIVTELGHDQLLAVPVPDLSDDESDDSAFVLSESCPVKLSNPSEIATNNNENRLSRVGSGSLFQKASSELTKSNHNLFEDSDSVSSQSEMSMGNSKSLLFDSKGSIQDTMR